MHSTTNQPAGTTDVNKNFDPNQEGARLDTDMMVDKPSSGTNTEQDLSRNSNLSREQTQSEADITMEGPSSGANQEHDSARTVPPKRFVYRGSCLSASLLIPSFL